MEVLSKMERHEFAVYKKEVEVETKSGLKKYTLLPLSARYYAKLLSVIKKFPQGENSKEEDFLKTLDEQTILDIHELVFATLKFSLNVKKEEEEQLELFVSQNLFSFVPAIVEINFGGEDGSRS